jgi:hypothetical protein
LRCCYWCCCCCCRAAIKLLQLVALPAGSPSALQLLQTLAAKACDKDAVVAAAALELLVQLEPAVLCSSLTAEQLAAVVQVGLDACCSSSGDISRSGADSAHQQAENTTADDPAADGDSGTQAAHAAQLNASKPVIASSGSNTKKRPASAAAGVGKQAASGKVLLSKTGQQQFLQLLRDVLTCDAAAAQHSQQQLRDQGVRQWLVSNAGRAVGVGGCRQLLLLLLRDEAMKGTCSRLSSSLC